MASAAKSKHVRTAGKLIQEKPLWDGSRRCVLHFELGIYILILSESKSNMARQIETLNMLLPQHVPSEDLANVLPSSCSSGRSDAQVLSNGGPATSSELEREIESYLARVLDAGEPVLTTQERPEDAAHDLYFHIRRVEGENDAAATFARTIIKARLILLKEADEERLPDANTPARLIDRALGDTISCLSGGDESRRATIGGRHLFAARYVNTWEPVREPREAMCRWICGHQLFAALTQALIFSFKSMARTLRAGKLQEMRRWADLSISLFRGSGAALQFTGDFTVEDYNNIVRPSMSPPASPICLSGLMSADHRYLVKTIHEMRPALKAFREQDRTRHDCLCRELGAVYDRHIFVCERFVGNKPSLLGTGRTEKPGPSVIEQFKKLRLKPFEHGQRAERLATDIHADAANQCPANENEWGG